MTEEIEIQQSCVIEIEQSIPQRFAQIAALHPHRLAVKTHRRALTYQSLDQISNRIAEVLLQEGKSTSARPHALLPIALLMEHDAPLIAALFGVLKAGAFYLCLDPTYPRARLEYILRDAQAALLITDRKNAPIARELADAKIISSTLRVINVDEIEINGLAEGPGNFSDLALSPDAPACLFYTSGSTGQPKGVVQSHRGTLHNISNYTAALSIGATDHLTLLSSCSFGASTSAIFGALLNGAALHPFDVKAQGIVAMTQWMKHEQITIYHSVPTLFRHFAASLTPDDTFPALRFIKLGGEPVLKQDVELYRRHFSENCVLVNGLGITEANGNVCFFFVDRETKLASSQVPVGYAASGIEFILVNDEDEPVGANQAGEILVASPHLATYWENSDRFKSEGNNLKLQAAFRPLAGKSSTVTCPIYRTGDLGRLAADGCLEYLGRKDDRLKVRGYRVEAAEVEAALQRLDGIREAAVTTRETAAGQSQLVAYIVPASQREMETAELQGALAAVLPDFMIPAAFISLAALPLLPNGKVDRQALALLSAPPDKPAAARAPKSKIQPPRDDLEVQLLRIWRRVLGIEKIGIADNFFELGGDSLQAAHIFTLIYKVLGMDVPLSTLAHAPTIEKLAQRLRERGGTGMISPLVALQPDGDKMPFYCVPGAGCDVLSLLHLANHLKPDQPFYGLQPPGLHGAQPLLTTVEEIATYYLQHVCEFQPQGPYFLGGSSFGGVVAFEMARQLQARGQTVAFVALLDTYGTDYPRLQPRLSWWARVLLFRRWLLPINYKDEPSWRNLLRGLWVKATVLRVFFKTLFPRRRKPDPATLRYVRLAMINFAARRRYKPTPFHGKITLFRVEQQPTALLYQPDPELGWHGLATKGIEIHSLPGFHFYHLSEPNVRILARKLKACLDQATCDQATCHQVLKPSAPINSVLQ